MVVVLNWQNRKVTPCSLRNARLLVTALSVGALLLYRMQSLATFRKEFPGKQNIQQVPAVTEAQVVTDPRRAEEGKSPVQNTDFDGVIARVFHPYMHGLPCFHPTDNQTRGRWPGKPPLHRGPTKNGFLYVKVHKTGSSSSAGVHLRIAQNVARRSPHDDFDICKSRCVHSKAQPSHGLDLKQRHLNSSFVWTMVREPTKRAISHFFHKQVSRGHIEPTDENFKQYLPSYPYAIDYLSTEGYRHGVDNPMEHANDIMQHYNFIGLTERIEESLVVLSMLLNLPLADVLSVSAKRSGGYDGMCIKIHPSFVSPGMKEHFASDAWTNLMRPEIALFEAVNRSLDLTIDSLGRPAVQARVIRYREAMAVVNEQCTSDTIKMPCTRDGVRRTENETDCYFQDLACGMDCLDQVANNFKLW